MTLLITFFLFLFFKALPNIQKYYYDNLLESLNTIKETTHASITQNSDFFIFCFSSSISLSHE